MKKLTNQDFYSGQVNANLELRLINHLRAKHNMRPLSKLPVAEQPQPRWQPGKRYTLLEQIKRHKQKSILGRM